MDKKAKKLLLVSELEKPSEVKLLKHIDNVVEELEQANTNINDKLDQQTSSIEDKLDEILANLIIPVKQEVSVKGAKVVAIRGKDGKNGIDGKKGDTGEKGKDGKEGVKGKDGLDGKNGDNGKDGLDGKSGKDGVNGKDGSPDTPDEVTNKVNLGKPLIKINRIEGLNDFQINMKQALLYTGVSETRVRELIRTLTPVGSTGAGGSTTQVQYNNAGVLAGSSGMTYNSTFSRLTLVGGLESAYVYASGAVSTLNGGLNVTGGAFFHSGGNFETDGGVISLIPGGGVVDIYGNLSTHGGTITSGNMYPTTLQSSSDIVCGGTMTVSGSLTVATDITMSGGFGSLTVTAGNITVTTLANSGFLGTDSNGQFIQAFSDRTAKKNILPLESSTQKLMQLRPVTFEWNDEFKKVGTGEQMGFIAQEVAEVLPKSVYTAKIYEKEKMGYKQLDLLPLLVKGFQEQQVIIQNLIKQLNG